MRYLATTPLESSSVYTLGIIRNSYHRNRFVLVTPEWLKKLIESVLLNGITAYDLPAGLVEN